MSLINQGNYSYGDAQIDIREELVRYSSAKGYIAEYFTDAVCKCSSKNFRLLLDDNAGVAVRICKYCQKEHPIGDSDKYLVEAQLEECECLCGFSNFEITVGVALYADSEDVKWLYVGCRCPNCNLIGCYGDWKNEFSDYKQFLARV